MYWLTILEAQKASLKMPAFSKSLLAVSYLTAWKKRHPVAKRQNKRADKPTPMLISTLVRSQREPTDEGRASMT